MIPTKTHLLVDSLVLQVVRCVSPVESLLLVIGRVLLHLEPDGGLLVVLLAVRLVALALHTDTPAAPAAGEAGVAGVTVLSPDQRGGKVSVGQTALSAQLRLVSAG